MTTARQNSGVFGRIKLWLDAMSYSAADYEIEQSRWVTAKIKDLEHRVAQLEAPEPGERIAA